MKSLRSRAFRPAVAAVAVAALGLGVGGIGPAASAAGAQAVSASLAKPVVAASCSAGVCSIGVAVGASGFPVSVTSSGVTASAGAVPAGDYVQVLDGTTQTATGQADSKGRFALTGALPSGQNVATIEWSTSPFAVQDAKSAAFSSVGQTAYLLTSQGTVMSWGYNCDGELGNGTNDSSGCLAGPSMPGQTQPVTGSDVPVQVALPAGTSVTAVAGGGYDGYALTSDGAVFGWGRDGNLCGASPSEAASPVAISAPSSVMQIAAGYGFVFFLSGNGTVWACDNGAGNGVLGNGTTASTTPAGPVQVQFPAGTTITAIAAGGDDGYALTSTGIVYAWGYNPWGQLGDGTNGGGGTANSSDVPVQVSGLSGVTAIAAGANSAYAVTSSGAVYAWGENSNGDLGDGQSGSAQMFVDVPTLVSLPSGVTVNTIAAGGGNVYAMTSGGVYAWGAPTGDGTTTSSDVPVLVSMPSGVTQVTAGQANGYALTASGTVYAWGGNNDGELGNGTYTASNTPVQVE